MNDCPSPHPVRDEHGNVHPDLEVKGAHASACWARCTKCGRWFWLETDASRFQYWSEWELDGARAGEAFLGREPRAVVALLTAHGLPHGPLWESPAARVALLVAMTEGATDGERIAALRGASLDEIWTRALGQMIASESARTRREEVASLPFALELRADLSGCVGCVELGGAVFLCRQDPPYAVLRVSADAVVQIPVSGRPTFVAGRDDAFMVRVAGEMADGLVLFREDAMIPLALETREPRYIAPLDDGHFLLCPFEVGTGERVVELRDRGLAFVASYRIALPHHESYPSHPIRVGDGWLASSVVDDRGHALALVLFDARFRVVAASDEERGPRHELLPLGDDRFAARAEGAAFTVELWERRGASLVRTSEIPSRGFVPVGDVLFTVDDGGEVRGLERDGRTRWSRRIEAPRPHYHFRTGEHVLVYGGSHATLFRACDGEILAEIDEPFDLALAVDRAGHGYVLAGPSLLRIRGDTVERTALDRAHRWATGIEDAIVLADPEEQGRYLVVGIDGSIRGEFRAPKARFSVATTHGGPYVLEPERLRIGSFPSPHGD